MKNKSLFPNLLQKISYLGGQRQYVRSNLPAPYGIAVFQDFIYWVDRSLQKLMRAPKGADEGPPKWLRVGLYSPADVVMFDKDKQPTNGNVLACFYQGPVIQN